MQRKLVLHIATSVDGFIAKRDGSFDCFDTQGDHLAEHFATVASFGAVIMGRKTYEVGLSMGVLDPYPMLDTYVVSRSMRESPHAHVQLVTGDPVEATRALKDQPGRDIYLAGGGALSGALLAAGLVDELSVKINPFVMGAGIPLSTHEGITRLRLASTKVHDSGVIVARYRVAAPS